MDILEKLNAMGVRTEEGLARCLGQENFYLSLVQRALRDEEFEKLGSAIGQGRLSEAFEYAHALKGACGNLSLTPLYEPLCEITEWLRNGKVCDYAPVLGQILSTREKMLELFTL